VAVEGGGAQTLTIAGNTPDKLRANWRAATPLREPGRSSQELAYPNTLKCHLDREAGRGVIGVTGDG